MAKKQQFHGVKIENMTNLGAGVAKLPDGRVAFVKNGVTGDVADIEIIKESAAYSVATVSALIRGSGYRRADGCASYKRCGGCVFRHIDYELEKQIKRDHVINAFKKIAAIDISPEPVVTFSSDRYRNNVRFPLGKDENGKLIAGFYSESSHRLVPVEKCFTHKECFDGVLNCALGALDSFGLSVYDEVSGEGELRYLCLRCNREGEVSVCIVVNAEGVSQKLRSAAERIAQIENVCGVYVNFNSKKTNVIFGEKTVAVCEKRPLYETICGRRFMISPRSFFQVNTETAEMLYNKAAEYSGCGENDVFVDLYCGTGTIGICVSPRECALYGCDIVPEAVENARTNALADGRKRFRYDCADASEGLAACVREFGRIDALIVDPPRKGLSPQTVNAICESGIEKFVYISCNPDTLARDVKGLMRAGYHVERSALFDLFPRTAHVETVVLMAKKYTHLNLRR